MPHGGLEKYLWSGRLGWWFPSNLKKRVLLKDGNHHPSLYGVLQLTGYHTAQLTMGKFTPGAGKEAAADC